MLIRICRVGESVENDLNFKGTDLRPNRRRKRRIQRAGSATRRNNHGQICYRCSTVLPPPTAERLSRVIGSRACRRTRSTDTQVLTTSQPDAGTSLSNRVPLFPCNRPLQHGNAPFLRDLF